MNYIPINNKAVPIETYRSNALFNANSSSKLAAEDINADDVQSSVNPNPTFIDVFTNIIDNAAATNSQKSQDMIDLMLGNTDDIEGIQLNIAKAQVATELLVTVKNTVFDAYNEIIKMQI